MMPTWISGEALPYRVNGGRRVVQSDPLEVHREAKRAKQREYNRRYYLKHKARLLAAARERFKANPEEHRKSNRAWSRRNMAYLVRYNRERRHAFIAKGLRYDGRPRKAVR